MNTQPIGRASRACLENAAGRKEINYIPTAADEQKVLKDILPCITTIGPGWAGKENDIKLIKKTIIRPFLWLYKKWPCAYKLIINKIREKKFDLFLFTYKEKEVFEEIDPVSKEKSSVGGIFVSKYPDNGCIAVDLSFEEHEDMTLLKDSIYHEIMHAINYIAVKDRQKGVPVTLSAYLDKKFDKKLTRLAENYVKRLIEAKKKCVILGEAVMGKREYDEYALWAYKQAPITGGGLYDGFSAAELDTCGKKHLAEEFLTRGLVLYFGTKTEKQRLKNQEPALYYMIERAVIPLMKKAPI